MALRRKWMQEELDELAEAATLVDQADALLDLIYFALGTLVEMGMDAEDLFEIVHNANMDKLRTKHETILRDDGKVGKPDGWQSPEFHIAQRLVSSVSPYSLITASDTISSFRACINMITIALNLSIEWPGGSNSAQSEPDLSTSNPSGGDPDSGSLTTYFSDNSIPLADDYLPPELLNEATFAEDLARSLATSPCVLVAFDTRSAYRWNSSREHWAIVLNASRDRVTLLDPAQAELGIQEVNCDSLLAGMRSIWHGLHRLHPLGNA